MRRNCAAWPKEGWLRRSRRGWTSSSRETTRGQLTADEERELDDLVACVDVLNILKARALYTLQSLEEA